MSNPFDESQISDNSDDILEGFLCPICKDDLKTPERLTNHVETLHSEEQDLLQSLKDIFSIAKKRIYKNIDETVDLAKNFDGTLKQNLFQAPNSSSSGRNSNNRQTYIPPLNIHVQDIGADCDHISYFKAIRTPRLERYATETNKLIIRLDKLLKNLPTDPTQRRIHEQKIVPWLEGKSVKLCPNCAKSFNITRRQHHCRVCGSILCHDCSCFLAIEDAQRLVILTEAMPEPDQQDNNDGGSSSGGGSSSNKEKEIEKFRICEHCIHLLENRLDMQDSRTYRPPVTILYTKIQNVRKEILPEIPIYIRMINSLYDGETIFTLNDASTLRGKIGRSAELIDSISKKIMGLVCHPGSREEALKRAIRAESVRFIKEEMLSIPKLPLESEIEKIRLKRQRDTELMIERERRLAREAVERYELAGGFGPNSPQKHLTHDSSACDDGQSAMAVGVTALDNWSGYQATASSTNDPLIEQINIIKGYIKQARQAMRYEEVETLEMNLRELQQEFYNRHQARSSQT